MTIPRYLEGQVPSKEYSDVVKAAMAAADSIESLFSVSDKMLRVIAYVFEKLEEVTPPI